MKGGIRALHAVRAAVCTATGQGGHAYVKLLSLKMCVRTHEGCGDASFVFQQTRLQQAVLHASQKINLRAVGAVVLMQTRHG